MSGRRSNGEGSIYRRQSDGLWVGTAYVLTTAGTRKRKVVYGRSFEEAHEKWVRLKGKALDGVPVPERSSTLREYLDYWLTDIVSHKKPTTLRGYESAVRLHIVPVIGGKRLDRLGTQDVRQLLKVVRHKCLCCANGLDKNRKPADKCCSARRCCKKHPSVRQVQYVHAVLRNAIFNAAREELVTRNVVTLVQVPTPRYRVGQGLSVDMVRRILGAAEGHRLHALYVLAATMGLRRGELLGLRWADVDLDRGTLRVQQTVQRVGGRLLVQDTKTEDSDRLVPLPDLTWRALKAHRVRQAAERLTAGPYWSDHDLVFPTGVGTPREPRSLNRHFEQLRAGLDLNGVRLHDLRHTVVTLLLELGVPPHVVQAIAGHADLDVTMKIYAHANLDAMRDAMSKLDGHLG